MEHPRPWSAEDIYNNSVTKKQITEWLQEHASSDFLVAKRLLGRIDNVARVHSKNYLAKCYLEVLQGNAFRDDNVDKFKEEILEWQYLGKMEPVERARWRLYRDRQHPLYLHALPRELFTELMKYVIANLWEEIGQRTQLKCVRTLRRKGDPNLRGLLTVDLFNTNLIACGGEEGAVEVWNADTGRRVMREKEVPTQEKTLLETVAGWDKFVFCASQTNLVRINIHTRERKMFVGHTEVIFALRVWELRGGVTRLFSCSDDKTARVWNIETAECVQTLHNSNSVWIIAYHPEKEYLLCGAESGNVFVWHLPRSTLLHDIEAHNVLEGGGYVTGSQDRMVKIWDEKWNRIACLPHPNTVYDVQTVGRVVAACDKNGHVTLWRTEGTRLHQITFAHRLQIYAARLSGDLFVTASADCTMKVWRLVEPAPSPPYVFSNGHINE